MAEGMMKAVVYKGDGVLALEERPVPVIQKPTDAIVKVTMVAICSSDLHIKHGAVPRAKPGTVLGHEIIGVIEETGSDVRGLKPGDRVTVNCETFCGECFFCKRGYVNNCIAPGGGWTLGCSADGGQAEYVRVPFAENCLDIIPDSVSDDQAMLVGDVLATGYWAAQITEIQPAETVVVIGAGPNGMSTAMCAKLYSPACLIMIDVSQERLEFAKAHGMADVIINPLKEDAVEIVKNLTEGRGADRVFEVAGGKNTFERAWQVARCSGVVCIVAMYEGAQTLPLHEMYGKNLTFKTGGIHASSCKEILKLVECGKLDASAMITHRVSLDNAMEGYRIFEGKEDGVLKVVIIP